MDRAQVISNKESKDALYSCMSYVMGYSPNVLVCIVCFLVRGGGIFFFFFDRRSKKIIEEEEAEEEKKKRRRNNKPLGWIIVINAS